VIYGDILWSMVRVMIEIWMIILIGHKCLSTTLVCGGGDVGPERWH
jgi:hypothetical protein